MNRELKGGEIQRCTLRRRVPGYSEEITFLEWYVPYMNKRKLNKWKELAMVLHQQILRYRSETNMKKNDSLEEFERKTNSYILGVQVMVIL